MSSRSAAPCYKLPQRCASSPEDLERCEKRCESGCRPRAMATAVERHPDDSLRSRSTPSGTSARRHERARRRRRRSTQVTSARAQHARSRRTWTGPRDYRYDLDTVVPGPGDSSGTDQAGDGAGSESLHLGQRWTRCCDTARQPPSAERSSRGADTVSHVTDPLCVRSSVGNGHGTWMRGHASG